MEGQFCAASCNDVPDCTHFSWTSPNGGTCFHKRSPIQRADAVPYNPSGSTDDPPDAMCGLLHARNAAEPQVPSGPKESGAAEKARTDGGDGNTAANSPASPEKSDVKKIGNDRTEKKLRTPAIVGIAAGVFAALVLVAGFILVIMRPDLFKRLASKRVCVF